METTNANLNVNVSNIKVGDKVFHCCKLFLPYYIQDIPPLLTNRPISKEKEFEIDLINKEVSDFLKKKKIYYSYRH